MKGTSVSCPSQPTDRHPVDPCFLDVVVVVVCLCRAPAPDDDVAALSDGTESSRVDVDVSRRTQLL